MHAVLARPRAWAAVEHLADALASERTLEAGVRYCSALEWRLNQPGGRMAVAYGLQARMTVADRFLDVLSHNWQNLAVIPGVHRAYPNAAASVRHGLQLAPSELKSYHSRAAQRIEAMRMGGDLTQMATDTIAALLVRRSAKQGGGSYMEAADAVYQPFEVLAGLAVLDP